MAAKKNFETDGLAGDYAQLGGVGNTDQVTAKTRGEKRSKVAKDFIDDQHVLYTDIAGTAEDKLSRTTPESA